MFYDIMESYIFSIIQPIVSKLMIPKQIKSILSNQSSILYCSQMLMENISKNIGVLRSNFRKPNGQLISICYGTAFAVSKRLILTCAHNIFHEQLNQSASQIYFIPNIKEGRIHKGMKIYRQGEKDFVLFQRPQRTYLDSPVSQDVALIVLSEQLQNQWFPQIGMGFKDEIGFGSTIRISGYPSKDYLACVPLYNANFKRKDLVGNLIHIYNHVIFHEMETEKGHSGGPIFAINSLGEVIIIGLHTHKGKDNCNKGIFFNDQIIKRIRQYEQNIKLKFGIKNGIKFRVDRFSNIGQSQNGKKNQKIILNSNYLILGKQKKISLDVNKQIYFQKGVRFEQDAVKKGESIRLDKQISIQGYFSKFPSMATHFLQHQQGYNQSLRGQSNVKITQNKKQLYFCEY